MNKEEFNKLDINKKVEYFNEELKSNNFTDICKSIGISKDNINPLLAKNGYEKVKQGQIIKEIKKLGEEILINVLEKQTEAPGSKEAEKENKEIKAPGNEEILKRIELLEKQVKELKIQDKQIQAPGSEAIIKAYDNDSIVKTFKINKDINKELDKFINENKGYKKQDIINSLLEYALSNIK